MTEKEALEKLTDIAIEKNADWASAEDIKSMVEYVYEKSESYREYVRKYAIKHNVTPEEALTHKIVKNVAVDYGKKEKRYAIS